MNNTFTKPVVLCLLTILSGCSSMPDVGSVTGLGGGGRVDIGGAVSAGGDVMKAATLSDKDVQGMALQFAKTSDTQNKLAPESSKYSKRLAAISSNFKNEDGLTLNFKAYLSPTVNAFALADGSVRVYSGLMDQMTDDELVFVIGHEIGHVKLGHSKQATRVAYMASATRKGVGASGSSAAAIASMAGGDLFEKVINSQFSQSQESDADEYGFKLLKKTKHDPKAAVTALRKLSKFSAPHSFLSTHPAPEARAKKLESEL